MTRPRPARAVVSLPALDVRMAPGHRAELGSQLLLGEIVRVLGASRDRRWLRIENEADRYRGWVRAWGVVAAGAARIAAWRARARGRIVAPFAQLRARPGQGLAVSPLYQGGRAIARGRRAGHVALELPDGRRGWVEAAAVATRPRRPRPLAERVGALLGAPYLWGGRTPLGLDCSGFTQIVLAEGGIALPRDAAHQARACRRLRAGEAEAPGDLLFFARPRERVGHVGLALGGGLYAHARGYVRLASLDPHNPLCDSDLLQQFRFRGRPPDGRPRGSRARESA